MDGYLNLIQINMDTLHRENKLFILLFIVCTLSFTACNKYKEYNTKEIAKIREITVATSGCPAELLLEVKEKLY